MPENLKELAAVCDYFVSQGITPIVANNDISLKTVALAVGLLPYYQEEDPVAAIERFNTGEDDLAEALLPGFELVERMLKEGWVDRDEAIETAKTLRRSGHICCWKPSFYAHRRLGRTQSARFGTGI